jgi:hypothetical protein
MEVRFPEEKRDFSLLQLSDGLCGPPSLLSNGYELIFLRVKVAGT